MFDQPGPDEDLRRTIDEVKTVIQRYFIVNDVRFDKEAFAYFVQLDLRILEDQFDSLRRELLDMGYIPMLLKERSGYIVYVTPKPDRKYRSIYVNIAFLAATIVTTIIAGMSFVNSYEGTSFWSLETVGKGALYFAAPLMFILGIHEMGHFFMARRHRVAASLPFFIPAPPILGTFGAFISLREPIHSKRALMDIGIGGPITGFVAAIFITVLGLKLSAWDPHTVGDDASAYWILGTPLIYDLLARAVPTPADVLIHPTAFAGWVGFLITFLNLLPAGQLDGGHIIRALFGDKARLIGYITVGAMVAVSLLYGYIGWIVFILFILFVFQHPPPLNDVSPLPPSRYMVGAVAFVLLFICFVPVPFEPPDLRPDVEVHVLDDSLNVPVDGMVNATLVFNNTGNTVFDVNFKLQTDHGWEVELDERVKLKEGRPYEGLLELNKDRSKGNTTLVNVSLSPPEGAEVGERKTFVVEVAYEDEEGKDHWLTPRFTVTVGWVDPFDVPEEVRVAVATVGHVDVGFSNWVWDSGGGKTAFELDLEGPPGVSLTLTDREATGLSPEQVNNTEPVDSVLLGNNDSARLRLWLYAPPHMPETEGLLANITVTLADDPNVTVPILVPFSVVRPTYEVDIDARYDTLGFTPGQEKPVIFELVSRSNVPVDVSVNLYFDETNFTLAEPFDDELTLEVGYHDNVSVRIFARGDFGSNSPLRMEIVYGPFKEMASVETLLRIESPS